MNPKSDRRVPSRLLAVVVLVVVVAIGFFVLRSTLQGMRFMKETGISPTLALQLIFGDGLPLKSSGERTNVLALGISGVEHDGPDLTDSIMVLSFNKQTRSMALLSIPRDLWSDTLKDKVNSAYHYGEEKKEGGGLTLAKAIVEDVTGIPLHYVVVVDFSGFKEVIDTVGGIEVNVPRTFTDEKFPIPGKEKDTCDGDPELKCVYETIRFEEGVQHMDGSTALKYVRSRNAEGEEGSDFARSRRQQDVIVALKNKILHPGAWFTPARAQSLTKVLDETTQTDMNMGELATLGKLFASIQEENTKKISFVELLESPPTSLYGRYVLVPIESFEKIHEYIREQLQ